MERPVILSIKSQKLAPDPGESPIELVTEGELERTGPESYRLSYRESAVTGMGDTRTTLEVEAGRLTMVRAGEVECRMVFRPGYRHRSLYGTPYGAMTVGIETHSLHSSLDEHGGEVSMEYSMELEGVGAGRTHFTLKVWGRKNEKSREEPRPEGDRVCQI